MSLCVAIAALGDRHLDILAELAEVLMDPEQAEQLHRATTANEVIRLLQPEGKAEIVKALYSTDPGTSGSRSRTRRRRRRGEARVLACSMRGIHPWHLRSGHFRIAPPRVMGHEIAGEIRRGRRRGPRLGGGVRAEVIAAIP